LATREVVSITSSESIRTLGAALRMVRVEVGRGVVVEEHRDRDPEEPADRRHATYAAASAGGIPDIAWQRLSGERRLRMKGAV
jgi:hypothetical protein